MHVVKDLVRECIWFFMLHVVALGINFHTYIVDLQNLL